jgi:hypothetical protein
MNPSRASTEDQHWPLACPDQVERGGAQSQLAEAGVGALAEDQKVDVEIGRRLGDDLLGLAGLQVLGDEKVGVAERVGGGGEPVAGGRRSSRPLRLG